MENHGKIMEFDSGKALGTLTRTDHLFKRGCSCWGCRVTVYVYHSTGKMFRTNESHVLGRDLSEQSVRDEIRGWHIGLPIYLLSQY